MLRVQRIWRPRGPGRSGSDVKEQHASTRPWGRFRRGTASKEHPQTWAAMGYTGLEDAVRGICTLCELSRVNAGAGRTVAVTSAQEREGRSTIARALAISLARDHAREVLLLEADLLRPSLSKDFDVPESPGLHELLADNAEPDQALQRTRLPNLLLLTAGGRAENPSRLLRSVELEELLDAFRQRFAFIVADLPAVLQTSDAAVVARQMDGTVLVVRTGVTEQRAVQQAHVLLHGVTIHGVVLNRYRSAIPGFARQLIEG